MKKKRKFRFPIQAKVIVMIAVAAILLVEVAMTYFSLVASNSNRDHYFNVANSLSATVSQVVDVQATKELKNEVKTIVDASPTHPTSEQMDLSFTEW